MEPLNLKQLVPLVVKTLQSGNYKKDKEVFDSVDSLVSRFDPSDDCLKGFEYWDDRTHYTRNCIFRMHNVCTIMLLVCLHSLIVINFSRNVAFNVNISQERGV